MARNDASGPDQGERKSRFKRSKALKSASSIAMASTVGFTMVICTAIGFFFGRWLDSKLNTDPIFVAVFTLVGAGAGFYELYRVSVKMSEDDKR